MRLPKTILALLLSVAALGSAVLPGRKTTGEIPPPGISFSHGSGVYAQKELTVTLRAPRGCTVAFTTDGTFPTKEDDSGLSAVEVKLEKGTARHIARNAELQFMKDFSNPRLNDDPTLPNGAMLCAAPVDAEGTLGETEAEVYFLNVDLRTRYPGFLVLSVVTDPVNLLDYDTGIFAAGAIYDAWRETEEGKKVIEAKEWYFAETNSSQRGRAWERPCVIQLYDGADKPTLEQSAGIRIQGDMSRRGNQKSLNFYFRNAYGSDRLRYDLFPEITEVKSFTLRCGGNTAGMMPYKDAMLQELAAGRAVTTAQSRPAVLFLNGEYWGAYLLTEKLSDKMLHDHYGVKKDQVVVIKKGEVEVGEEADLRLYQELMAFADQDLSDPQAYGRFCSVMDVQSFADFCAVRVYIGDADWSKTKNIALWRTRDDSYNGGRWNFILYDLEYSSALYMQEETAFDTDHIRRAMDKVPLFAAAMRSDEFRELFVKSLKEVGEGNYPYAKVARAIQNYNALWSPLLDDNFKRFGGTLQEYRGVVWCTKYFFQQRYDHILSYAGAL